jgi:translation initiation factor IF-1
MSGFCFERCGMSRNEAVSTFNGKVSQALPNTMFRVELDDGRILLTTLTGKMRKNYIRIFPGDRVKIEMTKYDVDRGRIVFKY